MIAILVSWLVLSVIVWLTAAILPGFEVRGFSGGLIVAAIFGALNWLLGWLLFTVIGLGTLGLGFLFAFVTHLIVNALLLKLTDALSSNLKIRGFLPALLGAGLISIFSVLASWLTGTAAVV